MRFGIGMNKDHTLEEVGQQFSATARAHPADQRQGAAEAEAPEPLKGTEERSARAQRPPLALKGESLPKAAAKTTSPASAESAEAAWPAQIKVRDCFRRS
jgi:hypothetical protein